MSKIIRIRNVPDELHRALKVRAAKAGMTLSDYLLSEIERVAEKPTLAEMMERLRHDPPVEADETTLSSERARLALSRLRDTRLVRYPQTPGIRAAVEVYPWSKDLPKASAASAPRSSSESMPARHLKAYGLCGSTASTSSHNFNPSRSRFLSL